MSVLYRSAAARERVHQLYRQVLDAWPVARQELRVPTRRGETFVLAFGDPSGPPVLLLHGSAGNTAMWRRDASAWAEAGFRCYAVDMIGEAGFSAELRPPLDTEEHAEWLGELIDTLGLGRVALCGVSLGGWLALDFAVRRPERVEALALVVPGGIGEQRNLLLRVVPLLLLGPWGARRVREMVFGPQDPDPTPQAKMFSEMMAAVLDGFRARRVKIPRFTDEQLGALDMPVLVIAAGRDVLLDGAETRDRVRRLLPSAQVDFRPEARHFIPDAVSAVLPFLRDIQSGA